MKGLLVGISPRMINGRTIKDLAGPVSTQMNWHDNLNVFCIYAGHSGEFDQITSDNIDDFHDHLRLPEECLKLGEYAVIVTNVTKFTDKIRAEVKRSNYGMNAGLVDYYNPSEFHGSFGELEAIFKKRDEFKHQKEYRFVFDTGMEADTPIILDIGDLSDITMQCATRELNELIDIKLPSNQSA